MGAVQKQNQGQILDTTDFYGSLKFATRTATTGGQNPVTVLGSSREEARSALSEYQTLMQAADDQALRQALVILSAKTITRNQSDSDLELTLEIYLKSLKSLPGDISLSVINSWSGKYFPAWAELSEAILSDSRYIQRRRRINALREFITQSGEPSGPPVDREYAAKRHSDFMARQQMKASQNAEKAFWTKDRQDAFRAKFDPVSAA